MGTYVVPFFSSDGPLVYEKVLKRFPVSSMGFFKNATEVRSMFETFLGQRICSHVGELESPGQAQASCPIKSSKKDDTSKTK